MRDGTGNISVVICAYTEQRWLELVQAVASIQRQTLAPREIILVVDHNPTLLARACQQLRNVIVVENRGSRGLSGARNSGVAVTTGRIIAFIDEDAVAAPDWLAWLNRHYSDPQVLGVGGAIEPIWQNDRPKWFPPEFDWVVGCTYRGMPETTRRVRNLIGCNMSFRREAFQVIGGFRGEIGRVGTRPIGCEETELCIRLNQYQPQRHLLYEPRSKVYHGVPASRMSWHYFLSRCFSEGLSKAIVSRIVGSGDGLSSERAYTFHTLPYGILRGVTDALRHRDLSGLARSAAIVTGLAATALGYGYGLILARLTPGRAPGSPASLLHEQAYLEGVPSASVARDGNCGG